MWEMKMHTELWIENIREEDQICDVNIKMELEEADVTTKLHSSGSGQELKVDFRWQSDKPLGFVKSKNFITR